MKIEKKQRDINRFQSHISDSTPDGDAFCGSQIMNVGFGRHVKSMK